MPAEECGRLSQRVGDGPAADDHELGDRAEHGDDDVLGDGSIAHATAEQALRLLAGGSDVLRGEQRRVDHLVAVETGHQADRLAGHEQLPQLRRELGRRYEQAAGVAPARQASDEGVDLADLHVDEPSGGQSTASEVSELGVEGATDERSDPAAARRDGKGVGAITCAEPMGLDHPGDVHLGSCPQACPDAERDAVHLPQANGAGSAPCWGTPRVRETRPPVKVDLRLLGSFELRIDGRRVTLPARRDPSLLLKRLAVAPDRRLHREQVIDALWPDAALDTVANRLHKSAHYLRKATGVNDSITLHQDVVALFPNADVTVDVEAFDAAATAALRDHDPAAAEDALALSTGELLPHDPYEPWLFNLRQRLALRHRDLLRLLGRHDELVALDATDEAAQVAVMHELLDRGDSAGVLRQFASLTKALDEELGIGPSAEAVALHDQARRRTSAEVEGRPRASRFASLATQVVHRCTTLDGVHLAYATSGSGPPLVKVANWLSHLDYDWESPVWRHWWQALSQHHTLVRYDERGCGLSDWDVDASSFTLEAWVRDLETVVDALGLERFPLLGLSQGGPIAITYAVRHPERVSHVVVYGTCARAMWERASDEQRQELAALGQLIRVSWGSDQASFRQVYDARFLPDGPMEAWRDFDELQRRSTSPRNAQRMWRAFGGLDCSEAASRLDVPVLIVHAEHDQVWSFAEAEELHELIPQSRLVALHSRNHILQAGEPAFTTFLEEVEAFLAS